MKIQFLRVEWAAENAGSNAKYGVYPVKSTKVLIEDCEAYARFDLVPGDHTASILWFRMQTTESGKMMPAIGRALRHAEGADLIAAWIDSLPPRDCNVP